MNSQSARLVSILSKCNPKDSELSYESKLQTIVHSEDYSAISRKASFSKVFNELFSVQKLRTYSEKELAAIVKAMPAIPAVLEGVENSLTQGVGPWLTEQDRPDFQNRTSLENLLKKLQSRRGKNYCNIPSNHCLEIFDGDVINSIGNDFGKLTADCSDYSSEISTLFGDKRYCISDAEVQEKEQEYRGKIIKYNEIIRNAKGKRRSRRFRKALIGVVFLFVPSLVGGLTGLLSSDAVSSCTLAEIVLVLLFWIGG